MPNEAAATPAGGRLELEGALDAWELDGAVAHFNAGPWGAMPRAVHEEQERLRRRAMANPHRFHEWEVFERFDESRQAASQLLGAPPNDIAFLPNVTTAMATVLASLPLSPGDEILLTEHTYETVRLTARRAATKAGATIVEVPLDLDLTDEEITTQISGAVTERTRIALIDHVASGTGLVLPVADIAMALEEQDVTVIVDGAHAVATLPLSVATLGVDVWIGSFNKWLGAPPAVAGVYVTPSLQQVVEPLVASHFFEWGFPSSFGFQGSSDHTARLCIPSAVAVHESLGWERVWHHGRTLARAGRDLVAETAGLRRLPIADSFTNSTVLPLPRAVASDLDGGWRFSDRLGKEEGCEFAVVTWRGEVLIRLSAHATNTLSDFERLGEVLARSIG